MVFVISGKHIKNINFEGFYHILSKFLAFVTMKITFLSKNIYIHIFELDNCNFFSITRLVDTNLKKGGYKCYQL